MRDVNRSNDFRQMSGDHSDEWRKTEKHTKQEKKKALKSAPTETCLCVLLHVFTTVALLRGRKI